MKAITPNELRLGNLMQDRKGQLCIVERLENELDDCKILCIDNASTYLPVEGIPLDESWLIKLGFEENRFFGNNTFEVRHNFDNTTSIYAWSRGVSIFIANASYVHQLQNLFYSLTGEELIIAQ